MASAAEVSVDQILAYGWGLLSVAPHSIPSIHRSEEYSNSPVTFGTPSARTVCSPTFPGVETGGRPRVGVVGIVCPLVIDQPPPHPRRGSRRRTRRSPRSLCPSSRLQPRRCQVDRVEDLLVAGAAAEVARQGLPYLSIGRVRVAAQQVVRRHDQAWRAEPALHAPRLDERLLHRVQILAFGYPLDSDDIQAFGLPGGHQAGADELAAEVYGARPALALLAGVLRAGHSEPFAQDVEQALALPDILRLLHLAVDLYPKPHGRLPGTRPRPT